MELVEEIARSVGRTDLAPIVRPMLAAWRQLRAQITVLDKAIHGIVRQSTTCLLLMSVPGIGVLSVVAYVSTVEAALASSNVRAEWTAYGIT